ncbi:MAG TPA: outer membrane beta-barrel protein [Vicinamibacterales bacterium]|nr:outer membrane beta-barrel protein [Vicinamibacterales bacterium]
MRCFLAVCALFAIATPAAAQSTYIGASLVADIARFDRIEFNDSLPRITGSAASGDGEALGFNLRIGRALGERWGVEFEFARSGEMDNRVSYGVPILTDPAILPIPDFQYELETEQRYTSSGAWAWVRQDLGDHVDLSYLGGIMFNRADVEQEVRVNDPRLVQWISVVPNMSVTEYSISPAVGIGAGFRFSEAAALTAGLRLHGVTAGRTGLLLRPSVGVRWTF